MRALGWHGYNRIAVRRIHTRQGRTVTAQSQTVRSLRKTEESPGAKLAFPWKKCRILARTFFNAAEKLRPEARSRGTGTMS